MIQRLSIRRFSLLAMTLICLCIVSPSYADSESANRRWTVGLGAGIQYGGVLGVKGSLGLGKTHINIALGAVGISAGIEYSLANKWTIGAQTFSVLGVHGTGVFVNYLFSGQTVSSWLFGIEFTPNTDLVIYGSRQEDNSNLVTLSVGYHFR